ncbi:hypothetical protein Bca52824_056166 [Brassica carinata]|uniref:Uncharacterized protein n=1 Tax=Brassica carinata TaxID=52824 RepID=A0A8X7QNY4_BRACI|nr:hypothetical protein Bca52824_056166 [Brassica carinata]
MSRVVVRLMIEPMVVVYLSLWDDAASMFRGLISSGDRTQSVMVVTTVNPKLFGGNMYLNSTPATKFYFDPALQAIVEFTARRRKLISFARLGLWKSCNRMVGLSFLAPAAARSLKSLGALSVATVVLILTSQGYRVELVVDDGADNATFVVFDKEMVKLTKQDAAGLTLDEMNGGESEELPQCVRDLAGKEIVFHIRVTPFNFTPSHRTFTVSSILDSIPSETFKTTEDEYVQVEGGEASASASKNVKGEANEPSPFADGGAEGTRKHLRE